jgi:hypothetical protein
MVITDHAQYRLTRVHEVPSSLKLCKCTMCSGSLRSPALHTYPNATRTLTQIWALTATTKPEDTLPFLFHIFSVLYFHRCSMTYVTCNNISTRKDDGSMYKYHWIFMKVAYAVKSGQMLETWKLCQKTHIEVFINFEIITTRFRCNMMDEPKIVISNMMLFITYKK